MNFLNFTDDLLSINAKGTITTYLNPYQYLVLRKEQHVLKLFDNIIFDGFLLPKVLLLFNSKRFKALPPDLSGFFGSIFDHCVTNQKSIMCVGGREKDIDLAVKSIKKTFPELNIVSYRHGYFDDYQQKAEFIKEILELNPEYVLVGMGAPYQENFALELKKNKYSGTVITCGGFFHQTARKEIYYPKIVQRLNIRWLYRIIDEPKLIKRYFFLYPVGIYHFAKDLLEINFRKRAL